MKTGIDKLSLASISWACGKGGNKHCSNQLSPKIVKKLKKLYLPKAYGVELPQSMDVVNFLLDGWRHKCREVPTSHLGPHGRVDDVERLQTFLVLVAKGGINLLDPTVAWHIFWGSSSVKVYNNLKKHQKCQKSRMKLDGRHNSTIYNQFPKVCGPVILGYV